MESQDTRSLEVATKKTGAPRGNRNAVRHGLRSSGLPKGFGWLARELGQFRRSLERAVADRFGEVDVLAAVHISAAIRGEQLARLAARWLATEGHAMTAADRTRLTHEISIASAARDRAVAAMGLQLTAAERAMREMRNRQRPAIASPSTPKENP